MRVLPAILSLLAAAAASESVGEAADAVLKADAAALAKLAARPIPDPWMVADRLCARGRVDAAQRFARAGSRGDLVAYIERHRGEDRWRAKRNAIAKDYVARRYDAVLGATADWRTMLDTVSGIRAAYVRGVTLRGLRRPTEAVAVFRGVAEAASGFGWPGMTGHGWLNAGRAAEEAHTYDDAFACFRSAREAFGVASDDLNLATAENFMGTACIHMGRPADALEHLRRALSAYEALEHHDGAAWALTNIGAALSDLDRIDEAREVLFRAVRAWETQGSRRGLRAALVNLGDAFSNVRPAEALEYFSRALALSEAAGDRGGVAAMLSARGEMHRRLGAFGKAFDEQRRALRIYEDLGDRFGAANTLNRIGTTHQTLGAFTEALDPHRRALAVFEELRHGDAVASTLNNLAIAHRALGQPEKALEYCHRAVAHWKAAGNRRLLAQSLSNLGVMLQRVGRIEEARAAYEAALGHFESVDDTAGVASALGNLGEIYRVEGRHAAAIASLRKALDQADPFLYPSMRIRQLWSLAVAHLSHGQPTKAAVVARRGVDALLGLTGRLADQQGVKAREIYSGLFDAGARAALRSDDEAGLLWFLEQGRAASLRESLGARDVLQAAVVPDELRAELEAAQTAERRALAVYRAAVRDRVRDTIRKARTALERARAGVREAVGHVQRNAKRAAAVAFPEPDDLATVRGRLGADEALVLYALTTEEAAALVVCAKETRIVPLGPSAALDFDGRPRPETFARARQLVAAPLALGEDVRRVLVSPAGRLAYVPFACLLEDRAIAYVPSATAHGLLLDDRARKGREVLALGDPDYKGTRLDALPGSAREVKAIGDVVLLGVQATPRALRATLGERERWRSVHLACHGRFDPGRPDRSALALTGGELTTLDVFRMRVPADLVVLSACETARGKLYAVEGVVGLTRAFMFAGAPRVIVSLWKVDDEATRALMETFYEAWKTMPTADALRAAQDHVRAQAKWNHPRFWAAWQLWGLGD